MTHIPVRLWAPDGDNNPAQEYAPEDLPADEYNDNWREELYALTDHVNSVYRFKRATSASGITYNVILPTRQYPNDYTPTRYEPPISFEAQVNCPTNPTFGINDRLLGTMKDGKGGQIGANEIRAGERVQVSWDGTYWRMVSGRGVKGDQGDSIIGPQGIPGKSGWFACSPLSISPSTVYVGWRRPIGYPGTLTGYRVEASLNQQGPWTTVVTQNIGVLASDTLLRYTGGNTYLKTIHSPVMENLHYRHAVTASNQTLYYRVVAIGSSSRSIISNVGTVIHHTANRRISGFSTSEVATHAIAVDADSANRVATVTATWTPPATGTGYVYNIQYLQALDRLIVGAHSGSFVPLSAYSSTPSFSYRSPALNVPSTIPGLQTRGTNTAYAIILVTATNQDISSSSLHFHGFMINQTMLDNNPVLYQQLLG